MSAGAADGSTPGADSGDSSTPCTMCSGQCVDVTTSTLNCGACGVACLGGQTCEASACKCPVGQAFCGGQCVSADRQHCGPTCSVCPADQICGATSCAQAPAPEFETTPLDPTGWQTPTGAPIKFKLKATGAPGTTYECRTGPDAAFTPSVPAWGPCDGGMGTNPVHVPVPDSGTPEGTYRTEYRYRSDTFKSDVATYLFYAHHKLDKVPTCPRPGVAADGPHFTDDQYFKAAVDYSIANGNTPFNQVDLFPVLGQHASDPFVLRGASIRIPFQNVHLTRSASLGPSPDTTDGRAGIGWGSTPFGTAFTPDPIVVKTLHHKYVLNKARSLMLVRRQYANPVKRDCKNQMEIGSHKAALAGPAGLGRGSRYFDCEAFVLDVHGQGLCMGRNTAGTAPVPQDIDTHVDVNTNIPACTLSGAAGNAQLTSTGGTCFSINYVGKYIEIPAFSGAWYKITAVAGSTVITVASAIPAKNPKSGTPFPGFPAGTKYRYGGDPTTSVVLPSGFAHLLHDGHRLPNPPPTNRITKCESPGCADPVNTPWLTYLPP